MSCRIISSLTEISDGYDAILCDLWGCYHNGVEVYPAAVAACRAFREKGGTVILLTNAPRPAAGVKVFLDRIKAPEDSYDAIVSSGAACQAALSGGRFGDRFHYVGPDRDLHMLTEVGLAPVALDDASAILITGLRDDRTESPQDYVGDIENWKAHGLPMLCANPDIVVDRGHQRLWCAGAIARDYEAAGGEVIYFGKPHLPVYDRCYEVLSELGRGIAKDRILAIGDGILTDVPGGIAAGLDTIFVTGGLAAQDLGPDPEHPQQDLLDRFLDESGLTLAFAIGRLR
ncbi:MAG: TIGR01459 family HAD-type hydrolase [Pseudomonadota bacterium]